MQNFVPYKHNLPGSHETLHFMKKSAAETCQIHEVACGEGIIGGTT